MRKDDQGVDSGRYQLVPRTLCFIFHGDDVLLLRGAPTKRLWANMYNAIGGHVKRGEDIVSAAQREIREETGLELDRLRLAGVVTIDQEPQLGVGLYVFVAESRTRDVTPSAEGEPAWFPRDALPQDAILDDLPTLLDRITSAQQMDPPFCAHYSYDANDELLIYFA